MNGVRKLKPKICRWCHTEFPPWNSLQVNCSPDCAIEYIKDKQDKQLRRDVKAADSIKRKESTQRKADYRNSDTRHQHSLTQTVFNKMRVLEELKWFKDKGIEPTCISCGKKKGGDTWCNGHFKSRAASGNLRYSRKNTFLQHNQRCNMRLSGDIEGTKTTPGYKQGLIDRFGDAGQEIIDYCESHNEVKKWTCDELIEMRKEFNKRIRILQY